MNLRIVLSAALAFQASAAFGETKAVAAPIINPQTQSDLANCVVDVGISSVWLGKAGLAINAAVKTCTLPEAAYEIHRRRGPAIFPPSLKQRMTQAACSASTSGIIAGLFYSASFAALAAADCQKSITATVTEKVRNSMCVSDSTNVVASLALVAQAGSQMFLVCEGPLRAAKIEKPQELSLDTARRLDENSNMQRHLSELMSGDVINDTMVEQKLNSSIQKLQRFVTPQARRLGAGILDALTKRQVRQAAEAQCAFDVGQATFFLTRAALMVNSAVRDCSGAGLYTGANQQRAVCSVDVTSIVGAFSFVASGISFAVFQCPAWKKSVEAACAGAIINIVAALSEVAAAASDFENSCTPPPPAKPAKAARRLDDDSTVV